MAEIGKHRPAKNVQPGWALHTDGGWHEVKLVVHTQNIFTGDKNVTVQFADGSSATCDRNFEVLCRTIPEVRRAAKEATR